MQKNQSVDDKLKASALHMADRLSELHRGKQFHEFQLAVFNAIFAQGKKRIFIRKGRKGGGTECVMYPVARIAGTIPKAACYIIGPTQKGQSEIIWDNRRIQDFLPKEWGAKPNEKDKRIRLANDSFIKIEGADNPDAARGWEGDIFVWDEYKDHNPLSMENCFPNLASRDGIWIVLGTPPTKMTSHYYQKEQEIKDDPDWAFFHWTIWDNPFLPGGKEWIEKERAKYIANGQYDLWRIEYEAEYVFNSRRRVIPNFEDKNKEFSRSELLYLLDRDRRHLRWVCSIDPGYATCFAVLFAAYNPYTSQIFYLDEIYSKNRTENSVRDMYPLILEKQQLLCKGGKWETLYDSAALAFAMEVYAYCRDKGLPANLVATKKSKTDEEDYFRVMNVTFAERGQAYVSKELKHFINELENYETDDKDNYPDKDNHQLDNGRYILKHVGMSDALKQYKETEISLLPKMVTLQDDIRTVRERADFAGFGGMGANFSIMDTEIF